MLSVAVGLILAKSLSTPRWSDIAGVILAKSLAAPRWSDIPGAYFDRISFCAPLVRYPRGLFWKNLFLRPAVLISPGLILTESLSAPRWSEIPGAYSDKISF